MRGLRSIHDMGLALQVGGIAAAAVAAITLFEIAPTREIAGQVGQVIFERLGYIVLAASVAVLLTRWALGREEPMSKSRTAALVLAALSVGLALLVVLLITPRMAAIWHSAPHAQDGSGLTGDDRRAFMQLHGVANLSYMSMMVGGAVQIVLQAMGRSGR